MIISASFETCIMMPSAAVKALDVTILFHMTWNGHDTSDCIMAVLNALPLQVNVAMIFDIAGLQHDESSVNLTHCCCSNTLLMIHLVLGLQVLASLSLLEEGVEPWQHTAYRSPRTKLQLPGALPRLRHLHFGSCSDCDATSVALWPLAVLAAQSTSEHEGESMASTVCAVA